MPPSPSSLTEGPVAKTLLSFSLPILASSVLQSINGSVNSAWIGRLLGERALTASANANSIFFLLMGLLFGLGMASTVLIAQSLGRKDIESAHRVVGAGITTFTVISVLLSGLGVLLAPTILRAMHTPADALPFTTAYLRVIFLALPGIALFSFIMMALRGAGDAKTPFYFLLMSVAIDVGLNPVLIRGVGPVPAFGIAGSALATLIAQWVSLAALIGWLYRKKHFLRITRSELRYLRGDPTIVRALVFKGAPMAMQVLVMSSSMVAMISLVNSYGSHTAAAYGACLQLWNYIQMPALSVGSAVSSMAAQNVGARRWDRVSQVTRAGLLFNVALTSVLIIAVTLADRWAFAIFLREPGPVATAVHIHNVVSWSFILFGLSFVLSSVVRATGAVAAPLAMLFVSLWLVRIPSALALQPFLGADALWWSFPIGSTASVILTTIYYLSGHWRRATMIAEPSPPTPVVAE